MRRVATIIALALGAAASAASAQPASGPYKVIKTVKAGGDGSWDYVYADPWVASSTPPGSARPAT